MWQRRPWARSSFGAALTDVTIPSQVVFKFFDSDPKQTRGKRISNLPRQELIVRDLNFLLFQLALCHELWPSDNPTQRLHYRFAKLFGTFSMVSI
jgi:hypothetical protein